MINEVEKLKELFKEAPAPQTEEDITNTAKFLKERTALNDLLVDSIAKQDFYNLRLRWSKAIKWTIFLLVASQIIIIIAVGLDWLDYSKYENLSLLFFGQTFAQVIGLAFLVVKFLFNKQNNRI